MTGRPSIRSLLSSLPTTRELAKTEEEACLEVDFGRGEGEVVRGEEEDVGSGRLLELRMVDGDCAFEE